MKLFNEIESEISGTIVKVLVNDSSPIEYDQPLFLVEPA
jgi:acetyl-CoA carboxylase biotin carboxyl carrier protein